MTSLSGGGISHGAPQMKRYYTPAAACPAVDCGHTSTLAPVRVRRSNRTTMPPRLPDPDAVDQTRFVSTGSGLPKPLSPPCPPCHMLRGICPPARLLLGPRYDGPSCRFPITQYGMRVSVVTWYICAIGGWVRS